MSTIMAIGAHPDDIEIGIGATLLKARRDGHRVVCVDLTDGELTPHGTREKRRLETARANRILGITERVCLELPNRLLMDTEEARLKLGTAMRQYRPDIIFTHVELDAHPDHVAAFQITRGAILISRIVKIDLPHEPWRPGRLYHYLCSHLRHPYQPSLVLEVTEDDFNTKLEAVMAYESQFVISDGGEKIRRILTARMQYFGHLIRAQYGEPVISQEPIGIRDILAVH